MFIRETALTYYNTIGKTIYPNNLSRGKLITINPELHSCCLLVYVLFYQTGYWRGQRRTDFVPWPKYHKKRNHL